MDDLIPLHSLLEDCVKALKARNLRASSSQLSELSDTACLPTFWVSTWADYSDKYGLGYMLTGDSYGVLFNDNTSLLLHANQSTMQFIARDKAEFFHTVGDEPEHLRKKGTLLQYLKGYFNDNNLLQAGDSIPRPETDAAVHLPYLKSWFRTRAAIVLHLSNGTLQINMFGNHKKIIVEPFSESVTILHGSTFSCYPVDQLKRVGVDADLYDMIKYAKVMAGRLVGARSQ